MIDSVYNISINSFKQFHKKSTDNEI